MKPPVDELDDVGYVLDFADIPLDTWEKGEDADNGLLQQTANHALALSRSALGPPSSAHPRALAKIVGPLRRQLKSGSKGLDVIAVKRALSRAGYLWWPPKGAFTPLLGPITVQALKRYQRAHAITPDGIYGKATHSRLAKHFDAYAIKLYQEARVGLTGNALTRQRAVAMMLFMYHNRHRIHYTMTGARMSIVRRRIRFENLFSQGDLWEDCSSIGKGLYMMLGLPDPNGFGYGNQYGFTGTMFRTGHAVTASFAKVLDAVFYGGSYSVPSHVAYVIAPEKVWSHGNERGPLILDTFYRPVRRAQRYLND